MLVIEGPDGAGKTSLGKLLTHNKVMTTVLDSPSRTRGEVPLVIQTKRYKQYYENHRIAVDRYLWSEMVYGPILRDICAFSDLDYLTIVSDLMDHKCPIVFCIPESAERLNLSEKQMPGVEENIKKIFNAYVAFAATLITYPGFFTYNFRNPNDFNQLVIGMQKWSK